VLLPDLRFCLPFQASEKGSPYSNMKTSHAQVRNVIYKVEASDNHRDLKRYVFIFVTVFVQLNFGFQIWTKHSSAGNALLE